MNRLIDSLFEKKMVVRIISILTALLMWFIVLDNDNPIEVKVFTVPLTSNVEVLEVQNLRIIGAQPPTSVEITVKGRRNKIANITSADFLASLDFDGISTSGLIDVPIPQPEYTGKQNILITALSPEKASLKLERITGVEFPVEIAWADALPEGYQAVNITMVPDTVVLEDKESLISRAARVVVTLNPLTEKTSVTKRVSVYTDTGEVISQFEGKIPVTINYDIARTVPVSTSVVGVPEEDWYVSAYRLEPSSIQVTGELDSLSKLTGLQASAIDVSGKAESFETKLEVAIPNGMKLYRSNPAISASVEMEMLETRTVTIPASLVELTDVDVALGIDWAIRDEEFRVTLKGKPEDLANFRSNAVAFKISVAGLEVGEHLLPISITLPSTLKLIGQNFLTVDGVVVLPEETPTPLPEETTP